MQTIMTRREIAEALGIKYPYQLQRVLPDLRKFGAFAHSGYRRLQVKNFFVIFRIDETNKRVIVVTVRYSRSGF